LLAITRSSSRHTAAAVTIHTPHDDWLNLLHERPVDDLIGVVARFADHPLFAGRVIVDRALDVRSRGKGLVQQHTPYPLCLAVYVVEGPFDPALIPLSFRRVEYRRPDI